MKFWFRWLADGVAIFLTLYLADSLLHERFHLAKTWPAVLGAIILGFINSFVRPLHRVRSKPQRAALATVINLLVNALLLQVFVWVGANVTTRGFIWVVATAASITLISGLINWQIGFGRKDKPRPGVPSGRRPARPTPK